MYSPLEDAAEAVQEPPSDEELFNELCPYYMALGMSYDEYWNGDPSAVRAYLLAEEYRKAMRNEEMWRQGLYNYGAVKAVIEAFGWGLGGGKGAKPKPYLDNPIPVTDIEKEAEKKRKIAHTLRVVAKGQQVKPKDK